MRGLLILLICVAAATGCAGPREEDGWPVPAPGRYRFDWRLSGHRAVAPLQVFDDGRDTWLQFTPGQALPAIFAVRDGGEILLPYDRRDPYVRIAGVWPHLLLRGGGLQAHARSLAASGDAAHAGSAEGPAPVAGHVQGGAPGPMPQAQALPVRVPAAQDGVAAGQAPAAREAADAPAPAAAAASPARAAQGFDAGPSDGNMRRTLARWAKSAGWTFAPEHWAVDVDIPLTATARFPADFKQAVRELLAATELSDRPLQPCFYANQVLRVVPWSQPCDRSAAVGDGA